MEQNGLNIEKMIAGLDEPTGLIGFKRDLRQLISQPVAKRDSLNDMIIGAITDYGPEDVEQWIVSLEKTKFSGKKIALVYNAKQPLIDRLQKHGFTIWALARANAEKKAEGWVYYYKDRGDFNICLERFWHIWVFLNKMNLVNSINDVRICLTDTKDVVFQKNPFEMEIPEEKSIMLASEGLTYENEPWGWNNINQAFGKNVAETMKTWEIHNAGVIVGRANKMFLDFLQAVYFYARGAKSINGHVPGGGGADQAALNIVASSGGWNNEIEFKTVMDDFVINAGTTNDPSKDFGDKLNGMPAILAQATEDDPFVLNNGVKTIDGRLYHVVHQYDRNPEWKEFFKKEYSYK